MPAWLAANEEVDRAAQAPGRVELFSVQYDTRVHPLDDPRRAVNLCLNSPEILSTPKPIAARLDDQRFALWSDQAATRWHLSTLSDTIVLGGPETTKVKVVQLEPARGGGSATVDVGAWWARDAWKSRTIADAVRALERALTLYLRPLTQATTPGRPAGLTWRPAQLEMLLVPLLERWTVADRDDSRPRQAFLSTA